MWESILNDWNEKKGNIVEDQNFMARWFGDEVKAAYSA